MNDSEQQSIVERLEKLERQNRNMKIIAAVFNTIVIFLVLAAVLVWATVNNKLSENKVEPYDEVKFDKTLAAIRNSLNKDKKEELDIAIEAIIVSEFTSPLGYREGNINPKAFMGKIKHILYGKTADEIIAEGNRIIAAQNPQPAPMPAQTKSLKSILGEPPTIQPNIFERVLAERAATSVNGDIFDKLAKQQGPNQVNPALAELRAFKQQQQPVSNQPETALDSLNRVLQEEQQQEPNQVTARDVLFPKEKPTQ